MELEKDNFPSLVVDVFTLRKTGSAQIRWQWPAHFLRWLSSTFQPLFHICWLVSYPPPSSLPVKIGAIFQGLAQVLSLKPFWSSKSDYISSSSYLPPAFLICPSHLTLNHMLLYIVHCIFKPICLISLARLKSHSGQGCLFQAYTAQ